MHAVITTTDELAALCERLAKEAFVTVDTEFMREKTYYPQLCLVQLAGEEEAAAIDPLAPGIDLAPLYALLRNEAVLKVFHACRQDMEIFFQQMGTVAAPMFDTQVAAMVLGYGDSVGYESLVNKILRQPVDKSSRFTDWSRRPLSDKQIDYAIGDVLHLRGIYKAMLAQLKETGREGWIAEEMEPLTDPATYIVDENDIWRKLRPRTTSPKYLAALQAVARWRELTARARNVPRGRVMKDEPLAEVAHARPDNFTALQEVRGFYPTMQGAHYEPLFEALREAANMKPDEYPRMPSREPLPEGAEAIADLLRLLLRACAAKHKLVPRLIADKDELEALAIGRRDVHALQGWRGELFGQSALRLLEGKVALKADGRNGITFVDVP